RKKTMTIVTVKSDATPVCAAHSRSARCENCAARNLFLCSHLDEKELALLGSVARTMEFGKGDMLFEQDAQLRHVFLITSGYVKLYYELANGIRQIIGFLGTGDIIGGVKRHAAAYSTAEALTDVSVCTFDREIFLDLLSRNSRLSFVMFVIATDEIEAHNDHLILLRRKGAPERLATFLLMFAARLRRLDRDAIALELPMSRTDIADHLGLTVESVSRAFTSLRGRGFIRTPRRDKVHLVNLPALHAIAGIEDLPERAVSLGF
ncbi:MAG: Crp/Fnr family transcriptional regulator, partial [Alphaproteobacteria bacterium]